MSETPVAQISEPVLAMMGLPEISTTMGKVGNAATRRRKAVIDLRRRMIAETQKELNTYDKNGNVIHRGRITGPLRPCTVVNFNPVDLVIEGQLNLRVPRAGFSSHHHLDVPFMGRMVEGHYMYISSAMEGEQVPDKEPTYYSTVTGHETDSVHGVDMPTSEPRLFSPHSIACELWKQYNSPDNKLMGGILMFDQNPQTLNKHNLELTNGRIWVPERIQVPDSVIYSYRLRETLLEDEKARIFETQRNYCDVILQQADAIWAEGGDLRKMVTDTHRNWDRFAVKMGWKEKLQEWTTAKLSVTGVMKTLLPCPQCGAQQPSVEAYFCQKCNAPYDAYAAFMANKVVPDAFLELLPPEQLDEVMEIKKRRKAQMAKYASKPSKKTGEPEEV